MGTNIFFEVVPEVMEKLSEGLRVLEDYDRGIYPDPGKDFGIFFLSSDDVKKIHDMIDGKGLRSEALLDSATHRPIQLASYADPTMHELAVSLGQGIILNHPFVDGNKKCAMLCMGVFMAANGMPVPNDSKKIAKIMIALAERKLSLPDAAECVSMCSGTILELECLKSQMPKL